MANPFGTGPKHRGTVPARACLVDVTVPERACHAETASLRLLRNGSAGRRRLSCWLAPLKRAPLPSLPSWPFRIRRGRRRRGKSRSSFADALAPDPFLRGGPLALTVRARPSASARRMRTHLVRIPRRQGHPRGWPPAVRPAPRCRAGPPGGAGARRAGSGSPAGSGVARPADQPAVEAADRQHGHGGRAVAQPRAGEPLEEGAGLPRWRRDRAGQPDVAVALAARGRAWPCARIDAPVRQGCGSPVGSRRSLTAPDPQGEPLLLDAVALSEISTRATLLPSDTRGALRSTRPVRAAAICLRNRWPDYSRGSPSSEPG
jgi:hypothetical protein